MHIEQTPFRCQLFAQSINLRAHIQPSTYFFLTSLLFVLVDVVILPKVEFVEEVQAGVLSVTQYSAPYTSDNPFGSVPVSAKNMRCLLLLDVL